jgi:predicted acyltransferase (DUF342 family)
MRLQRPSVIVALLTPLADAFREGRAADAERLQEELAAAEQELHPNMIPSLKRALAERIDGYGPTARSPVGTATAIRSKA